MAVALQVKKSSSHEALVVVADAENSSQGSC